MNTLSEYFLKRLKKIYKDIGKEIKRGNKLKRYFKYSKEAVSFASKKAYQRQQYMIEVLGKKQLYLLQFLTVAGTSGAIYASSKEHETLKKILESDKNLNEKYLKNLHKKLEKANNELAKSISNKPIKDSLEDDLSKILNSFFKRTKKMEKEIRELDKLKRKFKKTESYEEWDKKFEEEYESIKKDVKKLRGSTIIMHHGIAATGVFIPPAAYYTSKNFDEIIDYDKHYKKSQKKAQELHKKIDKVNKQIKKKKADALKRIKKNSKK